MMKKAILSLALLLSAIAYADMRVETTVTVTEDDSVRTINNVTLVADEETRLVACSTDTFCVTGTILEKSEDGAVIEFEVKSIQEDGTSELVSAPKVDLIFGKGARVSCGQTACQKLDLDVVITQE